LDKLTKAGWQALWNYGVRTVIDLRNEEECRDGVERPEGLLMLRVPFDAYASAEWIGQWWPPGLPNNFARYLEDYPQAVMDFGAAIVNAAPGGVVFHCKAGRDRTGLASLLLLRLAGVDRRRGAGEVPWRRGSGQARRTSVVIETASGCVLERCRHREIQRAPAVEAVVGASRSSRASS
jgi:hypothetical protein